MSKILCLVVAVSPVLCPAIHSIETGQTIMKVRSATAVNGSFIVGSSYEGDLLAYTYDGSRLWKTALSGGIMNNDLWCSDLDGDGIDEVLAASSDGSVYCVNYKGALLWRFQPNEVPMISVCTVRDSSGAVYVACGGNDKNFYWLSAEGELLKTVPSAGYDSVITPNKKWIDDGTLEKNVHVVNFLRPVRQADGSEVLLLNAVLTNADQNSMLFRFRPLEVRPFKARKLGYGYGPVGDLRVNGRVLLGGTSGMNKTLDFFRYDLDAEKAEKLNLPSTKKKPGFGYRVVQVVPLSKEHGFEYLVKIGSEMLLVPDSMDVNSAEQIRCKYSFNDMWKDSVSGKLLLASAQSGGSCIHVVDLTSRDWKSAYEQLDPPGTIQAVLDNTAVLKKQLSAFKKPSWERDVVTAYLMSPPKPSAKTKAFQEKYSNPKFLGYVFMKGAEDWDRSGLGCAAFEQARDGRKSYTLSQDEIIKKAGQGMNENGLCMWGGHGVDPFYYNPETLWKIMKGTRGKKSVFIWPELTILHKKEFPFAVEHLFAPFAENARKYNSSLYIRSKHNFWLGNIYLPEWSRFLSGEFADVAVPSMEETQDQAQDLSLAGRLGLWSSGVFDDWGTRCARDNPSFTRNRQFSHQELPNHFLRNAVYHIAYGATYINNFTVSSAYSDYMHVLWELIGSGALYIPKREEIVSFNPVHLSMTSPDERYMREAHTTTTSIRYDERFHPENPYVFGRLDGAWSGARVTDWDFSNYAAGVKDRRQNFLAPYPNGMVLITPPQKGVFSDPDAPRGKLADHLHPMYENLLEEYVTNGRNYFSSDGKETFSADHYAETVKTQIEAGAEKMPLTVSGDVAWVVAQTAPNHLRLTLIDGGYLNPSEKTAHLKFHTVSPLKITDLLSGETFTPEKVTEIDVPCGLFRFIDIELGESL
ncbi:hypothetical protein P9H32_11030 [Pontiella sp. NLcol2]|uniref:Lambda-carrageenase n=2 Tax=Pontiella agarivorans TaxID=3038953 RepID=A0ABU5MY90_9BACT|nr:hypothetical protein [Pontiella agarivorans]